MNRRRRQAVLCTTGIRLRSEPKLRSAAADPVAVITVLLLVLTTVLLATVELILTGGLDVGITTSRDEGVIASDSASRVTFEEAFDRFSISSTLDFGAALFLDSKRGGLRAAVGAGTVDGADPPAARLCIKLICSSSRRWACSSLNESFSVSWWNAWSVRLYEKLDAAGVPFFLGSCRVSVTTVCCDECSTEENELWPFERLLACESLSASVRCCLRRGASASSESSSFESDSTSMYSGARNGLTAAAGGAFTLFFFFFCAFMTDGVVIGLCSICFLAAIAFGRGRDS